MLPNHRRQRPLAFLALAAALVTSGCFVGDENHWASRNQIADAAARCGVPDFKPTKIGTAWAAYVDGENPDHGPKGDCIYADLERQGLQATR